MSAAIRNRLHQIYQQRIDSGQLSGYGLMARGNATGLGLIGDGLRQQKAIERRIDQIEYFLGQKGVMPKERSFYKRPVTSVRRAHSKAMDYVEMMKPKRKPRATGPRKARSSKKVKENIAENIIVGVEGGQDPAQAAMMAIEYAVREGVKKSVASKEARDVIEEIAPQEIENLDIDLGLANRGENLHFIELPAPRRKSSGRPAKGSLEAKEMMARVRAAKR